MRHTHSECETQRENDRKKMKDWWADVTPWEGGGGTMGGGGQVSRQELQEDGGRLANHCRGKVGGW